MSGKIELLATPITDIKEFTPADVGIIEGAVSNEHDEEVAKKIRANCKILMVWGDCACFGGYVLCATYSLKKRFFIGIILRLKALKRR